MNISPPSLAHSRMRRCSRAPARYEYESYVPPLRPTLLVDKPKNDYSRRPLKTAVPKKSPPDEGISIIKTPDVSPISSKSPKESEPSAKIPIESESKTKNASESEPKSKSTTQAETKQKHTTQSDSKHRNTNQPDPKHKNTNQPDPKHKNSSIQPDSKAKHTSQSDTKSKLITQADPKPKQQIAQTDAVAKTANKSNILRDSSTTIPPQADPTTTTASTATTTTMTTTTTSKKKKSTNRAPRKKVKLDGNQGLKKAKTEVLRTNNVGTMPNGYTPYMQYPTRLMVNGPIYLPTRVGNIAPITMRYSNLASQLNNFHLDCFMSKRQRAFLKFQETKRKSSDEALIRIASLLDLKDLLSLRLVNKKWKTIVDDCETWRVVNIKQECKYDWTKLMNHLSSKSTIRLNLDNQMPDIRARKLATKLNPLEQKSSISSLEIRSYNAEQNQYYLDLISRLISKRCEIDDCIQSTFEIDWYIKVMIDDSGVAYLPLIRPERCKDRLYDPNSTTTPYCYKIHPEWQEPDEPFAVDLYDITQMMEKVPTNINLKIKVVAI